jgi:hypothetical protein
MNKNPMMKPQEHIQRAGQLAQRLRNANARIYSNGRPLIVPGVDPNELKKILVFLMKHRDMSKLRKLIDKLPESNFGKRSASTPGYYKNIQSSLGRDFFVLGVEDAIHILAWTCRLL